MNQKLAIMVFRGVVSPRLDIAEAIWVYHQENQYARRFEICPVDIDIPGPMQLVMILKQKDIHAIICGGCPRYYLRVLIDAGFNIYMGGMGSPDELASQWASGQFPSPTLDLLPGCYCHGHQHRGKNKISIKKQEVKYARRR